MARTPWYRLDNVGKYYSSQAGRAGQTVFRFAATFVDSISPEALQRALDRSIALFPGFNVKLRSGLFWHYLEPADEVPQVEPERLPICAGLHADLNSVLMRVTYFRHRINLEVSHMISDGRGTLEFFKTLLNAYVVERYHATPALPSEPASTPERRNEDSYTTNYERSKAGATESEKVYHLFGWKNTAEPTFMEYHLSASAVHSAAKNMGVSVTSLVIAAVIVAIRATMPPAKRDRAIRMDVPVDLRAIFGSETLRNFFGLAFISYTPGSSDAPLEDIAHLVQTQLKTGTEPEVLKRRMNRMLKIEKPLHLACSALLERRCTHVRELDGSARGHHHSIEHRTHPARSCDRALRIRYQCLNFDPRNELPFLHVQGCVEHRGLERLRAPRCDAQLLPRFHRLRDRRGDQREQDLWSGG